MNLFSWNVKIGGWLVGFQAVAKSIIEEVEGFSNRCRDGKYVFVADFDNIPFEWLVHEMEPLIDLFKMGKVHIIQSSKYGYHAVCFDKFTLRNFLQILENTSADYNFIHVPLKFGPRVWNLRTSKKRGFQPKYIGAIPSKYEGIRQRSYPHIAHFNKIYNQDIDYNHIDKYRQLIIARYQT